jgi:putative addiction module killer protein
VTQPVKPKQVVLFTDKKGKQPFAEWVYGLKEVIHRQRIISRIRRLEQGNFGDCKVVGGGVRELRLFFGVGYRVYLEKLETTLLSYSPVEIRAASKKRSSKPKRIGWNTWPKTRKSSKNQAGAHGP